MPRTTRSAVLDSRSKRLALPAGKRVTCTLADGVYLLYRRPLGGGPGTWSARWRNPETKEFTFTTLGQADDMAESDGRTILAYKEAKRKAAQWCKLTARRTNEAIDGFVMPEKEWTVRDVILFYIADARKKRKNPENAEMALQAAEANILPELGDIPVPRLTWTRITKWHHALAARGRRKTGKKHGPGEEVVYAPLDPTDQIAVNKRKSSANRDLALLKGALGFAIKQNMIDPEHTPWQTVMPFPGVTGSRVRFLSVDEQQKLVGACDPEFRLLVCGALLTGARYQELATILVRDYDPASSAVRVEGKGQDTRVRWVYLTEEGDQFFRDLVKGRNKDEWMFVRKDVKRTTRGDSARSGGWMPDDAKTPLRLALKQAGIEPMTFHELRHTYASMLILKGMSLKMVADQLGHADTRMVEKHYGHLAPSARRDAMREMRGVQLNILHRKPKSVCGVSEEQHIWG